MASEIKIVFVGENQVDQAAAGAKKAIGGIGDVAKTAAGFIGGSLVIGGLGAARDAIGGVVSTAADYEMTMNRFKAVTGDAIDSAGLKIENFNQLFLDMGAKTQFSAGEAAQAAVELAKGGIDPATIAAGGLEAALGLAAAGELDLAAAAEITAKQIGVWASQGVDAAMVADRMAQAANASTVNVDDLAIGMANVGGVAKVAGLSFDETTQAMALLAPGFSSASDAGTSFKAFLNNLIPTSKSAITAAEDLGLVSLDASRAIEELSRHGIDASKFDTAQITIALAKVGEDAGLSKKEIEKFVAGFSSSAFYDAQGQFIGMEAAAGLLQEKMKGLTQEQKSLALETIFGADAQRAAALLAEQGAEGYGKMGLAMQSAGTATEQAAERNKGFNFAMESLKGALETIAIVVGTKLLPPLTDFLNNIIIPGVNSLLSFAQGGDSMSTAFGGLTEKFPGLKDIIGKVMTAFQGLSDWFSNNWPLIEPIVTDVLNAIVNVINDPLLPVIGAILTAVGGLVSWIVLHWPEIKAAIEPVLRGISDFIKLTLIPALGTIITEAGNVIKFLVEGFPKIKAAVESVGNDISEFFRTMPERFINFGKSMIAGLVEGLERERKKLFDKLVEIIPEPIRKFLNISSPSKLFAYYGEMSAEGYIKGFVGGMRGAALGQNALSGAGVGVGSGEGVFGGGRAVNVTINVSSISSPADVDMLARQVARRIREAG